MTPGSHPYPLNHTSHIPQDHWPSWSSDRTIVNIPDAQVNWVFLRKFNHRQIASRFFLTFTLLYFKQPTNYKLHNIRSSSISFRFSRLTSRDKVCHRHNLHNNWLIIQNQSAGAMDNTGLYNESVPLVIMVHRITHPCSMCLSTSAMMSCKLAVYISIMYPEMPCFKIFMQNWCLSVPERANDGFTFWYDVGGQ